MQNTEAFELQQELARQVVKEDCYNSIQYVAGVDVAYSEHSDELIAAVVILESDTLNLVESVVVEDHVHFPYILCLFSFRELPSIVKAFNQLKKPQPAMPTSW